MLYCILYQRLRGILIIRYVFLQINKQSFQLLFELFKSIPLEYYSEELINYLSKCLKNAHSKFSIDETNYNTDNEPKYFLDYDSLWLLMTINISLSLKQTAKKGLVEVIAHNPRLINMYMRKASHGIKYINNTVSIMMKLFISLYNTLNS